NISFSFQTMCLASFVFFCALSLFLAQDVSWGLRKLIFIFSFVPLYFVVSDAELKTEHLLEIGKALIFGGFLSAVVGIFQFAAQFFVGVSTLFVFWAKTSAFFLGNAFSGAVLKNNSWLVNLGGETVFRVTSFFPDPHIAAFYFGMLAPVALGFFFVCEDKKQKKMYLFAFLTIILADALTFSRGGYMGIFSGLLFFGLFFLKDLPIEKAKKILMVIGVIIVITIAIEPIRSRIISSFNIQEGSNSARIETWRQSIDVLKDNYLTGVGLGNYALEVKPTAAWREPIYSHNLYLDIWAETGFFGFISWVMLMGFSIFSLVRTFFLKRNAVFLGVASGIIVFCAHSLFETALFSVHVLAILMIFVGISATKMNEVIKKSEK
ncbi:MAG: O-antigen ligase family protein, partial [Candidatus Moranbacteria bacterium]|nr:O-antigen ligase family protein [Candidatus Moranbacteria bacterium]